MIKYIKLIYLTTMVGHERRYKILCANAVPEPCDPQKATQIILDTINLESDQYRMGHTKVSDTCCGPRCDNSVMTRQRYCKLTGNMNVAKMLAGCLGYLVDVFWTLV